MKYVHVTFDCMIESSIIINLFFISVARRAELEAEVQTLKTQLTIKNEENETLARQVEDMHSSYSLARQKSVNFEESSDK